MQYPPTSREDLIRATKKNELIIETGRQIQKDFGEFNLEINFSGKAELFYTELYDQMRMKVEELISYNMNSFLHLLYRIDINEAQIALYEKEMPEADYSVMITELIIHRELKKVITRDFFRQMGNKNIELEELDD